MNTWRICGRCFAAPPPAEWRAQLAARLGQRPRRIGLWAELALFGALNCLDDAGETALPDDALISVASLHGPDQALRAALAEARGDLPLPIGFMQSQPSQLLPLLAQHLRWQGDGRCLTTRDPLVALHLAICELGNVSGNARSPSDHAGLLLGWIDETAGGASRWLRLKPAETLPPDLAPGDFARLDDPQITYLRPEEPGRLLIG
jgi:hypothetical protein